MAYFYHSYGKTVIMKKIILLVVVLIVLVALDLATGIFYWNRLHLVFDADNFNNILSPIVGFTALVVNALVLILFLKQTKIIQSQNLKPFFLDRISRIEQESKSVSISHYVNGQREKLPGFDNAINLYIKTIKLLEHRSDYKRFVSSEKSTIQESKAESSTFFKLLYPLIYATVPSSEICLFVKKVKRLIDTINSSSLLDEDKQYLVGQINSEILSNYNDLIDTVKTITSDDFYFALPCVYADELDEIVPIVNLLDTDFIISA